MNSISGPRASADEMNEQDVREDLAAPLLTMLGYQRGSTNDILRGRPLAYGRIFLGRKKQADRPLRGIPDYVLAVAGAGRWVLETKSPSEGITLDAIEQAISYGRHPEISASYAAVLDGCRFVLFHSTQKSTDDPLLDLAVTSPPELAAQLSGLLSPSAIRRDCSPPIVDLGTPLADGFRSRAEIRSGTICYERFTWECNFPVPPEARAQMDETTRRLSTFRTPIIGGQVWRDEASRIRAKLDWAMPHDEMMRFAREKKLKEVEYLSLDTVVSIDPARPTVFDAVGRVVVERGETLFDIVRWDTKMAGLDAAMVFRGQAAGHILDGVFSGEFQAEYEATFPAVPSLLFNIYGLGRLEIALERA
jgi:hypothetical protein